MIGASVQINSGRIPKPGLLNIWGICMKSGEAYNLKYRNFELREVFENEKSIDYRCWFPSGFCDP